MYIVATPVSGLQVVQRITDIKSSQYLISSAHLWVNLVYLT